MYKLKDILAILTLVFTILTIFWFVTYIKMKESEIDPKKDPISLTHEQRQALYRKAAITGNKLHWDYIISQYKKQANEIREEYTIKLNDEEYYTSGRKEYHGSMLSIFHRLILIAEDFRDYSESWSDSQLKSKINKSSELLEQAKNLKISYESGLLRKKPIRNIKVK